MQLTPLLSILMATTAALATPLFPRANQQVSGAEVTDTTCTDPSA